MIFRRSVQSLELSRYCASLSDLHFHWSLWLVAPVVFGFGAFFGSFFLYEPITNPFGQLPAAAT